LVFIKKTTSKLVWITTVAFWSLTQIITFSDLVSQYHPLMHLSTFLFGIASMKVILDRKNLSTWSPKAYLIIFISATPLLLWILTNNTPMVQLSHNGLLSPLFAELVFSIIHLPKRSAFFYHQNKCTIFIESAMRFTSSNTQQCCYCIMSIDYQAGRYISQKK